MRNKQMKRAIARTLVWLLMAALIFQGPLIPKAIAGVVDANAIEFTALDPAVLERGAIGLAGGKTGLLYKDSTNTTYYYKVMDKTGTIVFTQNISTIMGSRASNVSTLKAYPIAGGKTIITWEGTSNGCDNNTGNMIQFIILDAAGNLSKSATDISTQTASYNCFTNGAELSNGNIAFIWQNAGDEYFMRIFDASGNSVTTPASIDKTGTREALGSYDSTYTHSIAANNNGTFMITYNTYNSTYYYGVIYNNNGTQKTINGYNHFKISNNQIPGSANASVFGLSNDSYAILYNSGTNSNHYLKIMKDDGTAVTEITNPDLKYLTTIAVPKVVPLADGGFLLGSYDSSAARVGYGKQYQNNGTLVSDWQQVDNDGHGTLYYYFPGYDGGFGLYNGSTGHLVLHSIGSGNANPPVITSNGGGVTASVTVNENTTAVTTVTATDADAGSTLTYSILGGTDASSFTINPTTGVLAFLTAPDREVKASYAVTVQVSDGVNTDTQAITVTVNDVNDTAPVITSNGGGATASVSVNENTTAVTTVTATDADTTGTLTYSISGGTDASAFTIDPTTGMLAFLAAPDHEVKASYAVTVQVSDGVHTDTQAITVTVNDVNEFIPSITSNGGGATASVSVNENTTAVTTVTATDADAGSTLSYSISGGTDASSFTIDSTTGVLVFLAAPDREVKASYAVTVQVSDGVNTDTQAITVTVNDVNDTAPVITSNGGGATASVSVNENTTAVTTVTATDADTTGTLTYSISGGTDASSFTIDSTTGVLVFLAAPDREVKASYAVTVQVSDGVNTDTQAITVTVNDVNDTAPVITSNGGGATASVSVNENTTAVTTVTATDADTTGTLTYSISGGTDASSFTIDPTTGVLAFLAAPDHEVMASYAVTVQVSDGVHTDTQAITVTVNDVNEFTPSITSDGGGATANVSVNENTTAVTTVTATDADTTATLTYSISGGTDASSFTIGSTTGVLVFLAAPDREVKASYAVTVQVSDGVNTDTQTITVTVNDMNDTAPVITSDGGGTTASVSVNENTTTAVTTVTATDADTTGTLTYSISGGTDASSFTIDPMTGVLVFLAAPDREVKASYAITVQVSDGVNTDTQAITVTVNDVNDTAPVITSNGGGATASVSVNENTTAVTTVTATDADTTGALTYSISGGTDASSFTIDPTTGVLVFLAAPDHEVKASYAVTVQVSDGVHTDTQAITVTVNDVNDTAPVITSNGGGATASVSVNENTTAVTTVTATDADTTATLTYSISGGTDATAFTINATTGVLAFHTSPNHTAPTDADHNNVYEVTVQVSDGTNTDVQSISVTIIDNIAPGIQSVTIPGDGIYRAGQTLDFSVLFSEPVQVSSGIPTIALTIGAAAQQALYFSGSGTNQLLFRYIVQTGDEDTDGILMDPAIVLNGSSLQDLSGHNSGLVLSGAGSTAGIKVDTIAPTVQSVQVPVNRAYVAGDALDFTISFDEIVTLGNGSPSLGLTVGSNNTLSAVYQSGSGSNALAFRYVIQAGDNDANGIEVSGPLALNGAFLRDAAGNNADLTLHSVANTTGILVDTTPPAPPVVSVTQNVYFTSNTFTILGTGESGAQIQLFIDDTLYDIGSITGGSWGITISGLSEGAHTVKAVVQDQAGNTSAFTASIPFFVDVTVPGKPTITLSHTQWTRTDVTASVYGDTHNLLEYKLGNSADWSVYTAPLSIVTEGEQVLFVKQTDPAGNVSAIEQATIRIDKTAPSIQLNQGSVITIYLGDPFTDPGALVSDNVPSLLTATVTGSVYSGAVGSYTLRYNAVDLVGNPALEQTRIVNVVPKPMGLYFDSLSYRLMQNDATTFSVKMRYSTGQEADVTAVSSYTASVANIVQITSAGNIQGVKAGHTVVTAVYGSYTAMAEVFIDPIITGIQFETASVTLASNQSLALLLNAKYSDGSLKPVTLQATYTFTAAGIASISSQGVLMSIREGSTVLEAKYGTFSAQLIVTVDDPDPQQPQPIATNSGSSRQVIVDDGNGKTSVRVTIVRIEGPEGKAIDQVDIGQKTTEEAISRSKEAGSNKIRILIDDLKDKPVDEVIVNLSKESIGLLSKNTMGLTIETEHAVITIPQDSLKEIEDTEDLFFKITPIKKEQERQKVEQRTVVAPVVVQVAGGRNVQIVGVPMIIETNLSKKPVQVTFPIRGIEIPTDARMKEQFLASLAVYIEHSDGEKVLQQGKIVFDDKGVPVGIEIAIEKFSTFTIVSIKGNAVQHDPYLEGYDDGTFRPNHAISRAEMAMMLSRLLVQSNNTIVGTSSPFPDVSQNHWALQAIVQVKQAKLMVGDDRGTFHPDDSITRGEIAAIVSRWLNLPVITRNSSFKDIEGHWAKDEINRVQEKRIISGYEDGTYRPDQKLTRAEAVTIMNRMLNRRPLHQVTTPTWTDVPSSYWAFPDIEEASLKHHSIRELDGSETYNP